MLRTVLVSADEELNHQLENELTKSGLVALVRVIDWGGNELELFHMVDALRPQLLVANIDDRKTCFALAAHTTLTVPETQIVATGRTADPDVLTSAMTAGVREFLRFPFESRLIRDALIRAAKRFRTPVADFQTKPSVVPFSRYGRPKLMPQTLQYEAWRHW